MDPGDRIAADRIIIKQMLTGVRKVVIVYNDQPIEVWLDGPQIHVRDGGTGRHVKVSLHSFARQCPFQTGPTMVGVWHAARHFLTLSVSQS